MIFKSFLLALNTWFWKIQSMFRCRGLISHWSHITGHSVPLGHAVPFVPGTNIYCLYWYELMASAVMYIFHIVTDSVSWWHLLLRTSSSLLPTLCYIYRVFGINRCRVFKHTQGWHSENIPVNFYKFLHIRWSLFKTYTLLASLHINTTYTSISRLLIKTRINLVYLPYFHVCLYFILYNVLFFFCFFCWLIIITNLLFKKIITFFIYLFVCLFIYVLNTWD